MADHVATPLPGSVTAAPGPGGLDQLTISTGAAQAQIVLQGAHVLGWAPAGTEPVLFASAKSAFAPGAPIRGGIPVCFPWFGPGPTPDAALHGFARTAPWRVTGAVEAGDEVAVTLDLAADDVADRSAWAHPFQAQLEVRVGASLTLTLTVTNPGDAPVTFQEAFHTYLAVGDVRQVRVEGLADQPYLDRLADATVPPAGAPLQIVGETDRVYPQPGTISVVDPALARTLTVTASGSANAVVWNPWTAKAAAMADFGDDEWTAMLCVETCNVLDQAVTLEAGGTHSMSATLAVAPGG